MYWLSLGENCLPDHIISRHQLKGFATPYSHGRSNIDYALALEDRNYAGLLDVENLGRFESFGEKVVRSTLPLKADPIFHPSVSRGFEFTHHDVIANEAARQSYHRKIERLQRARGQEDITFLYHYRMNRSANVPSLLDKLQRFASFYTSAKGAARVVAFTQSVSPVGARREVECIARHGNTMFFVLHTRRHWSGADPDVFWARCDDDLIARMLTGGGLRPPPHRITPTAPPPESPP